MATANPDEAEITCKNPNCTEVILKWNNIIAHVAKSKKCKNFYTEDEITQDQTKVGKIGQREDMKASRKRKSQFVPKQSSNQIKNSSKYR